MSSGENLVVPAGSRLRRAGNDKDGKVRSIDFIIKESLRRPRKSLAALLFIVLAISIFVACQTLNKALEDRTKEQLLRFGANIVVRPKGQPFDLHAGTDEGGVLLPETYTDRIQTIKHHKMLVAVSPKLYERFTVSGQSLLVAGITPAERKAKPWWLTENDVLTDEFPLGNEILLGHFAAGRLDENVSEIRLGAQTFRVSGVLDETGSPDDFMAFVPLGRLQSLRHKDGMVNVVEVSTSCIACKAMDIRDVAREIDVALPDDAHVLLVRQVAEAQMGTLKKVAAFTWGISTVILGLCVLLLMNYISASVENRKREVGMLLAMGMDPRKVQLVFVGKVLLFATVGGVLGYVIGSGASVLLGPAVAGADVPPIGFLLPVAVALALVLAFISSILPTSKIARIDPVEALREM